MNNDNFVSPISTQIIKPCNSINHSKPFKLSFLDQLIPTTYVPFILFYTPNQNSQFSSNLKNSLAKTLSTFFPFSGRLHDNLNFVHNFDEGIPFIQTKVNSQLSEFLQNPQLEILNQFLPTQPFSQVSYPNETLPLLYVQLNIFQCGGIALGICISHKIADAESLCTFLRAWADNNKNIDNLSSSKIIPNFDDSSLRFPPFNSTPFHQKYVSIMENFLFNERKRITRRFNFDSKAISSLKEKAATQNEKGDKMSPTRIKTLSSFIWKCCTKASASISSTPRMSLSVHAVNIRQRTGPRMSLSVHAVNIRQRTGPRLSEYSTGNLFWWAVTTCNVADHNQMSLKDFVALTNESVDKINVDYLNSLEGEKGIEVAFQFLDQVVEIYSRNPEMFGFSSWMNFGGNELDFGWGKPIWVSFMGEVGPAFRNLVLFKESMNNDGIEAWITLNDDIMELLEGDPEFLAFANPNPSIFH